MIPNTGKAHIPNVFKRLELTNHLQANGRTLLGNINAHYIYWNHKYVAVLEDADEYLEIMEYAHSYSKLFPKKKEVSYISANKLEKALNESLLLSEKVNPDSIYCAGLRDDLNALRKGELRIKY